MTVDPVWRAALQWSIWGVFMSLVMGWLARSRKRARPAGESLLLRHPPSTLILGIICFGFFAAIAVVSNVIPNTTATWWTTAAFLGFALLSVPMISDYFIARCELSEEGMTYRKLFGARKYLRWSDLRSVRYAKGMKWFRLRTTSGEVARVSAMLMGLPEFARLVLAHAPQGVIAEGSLAVLQATAQGNPPSIWR